MASSRLSNKPYSDALVVNSEVTSVELIESWFFATSRRRFSIYSERLILRILQLAQSYVLGANFKDGTSIGQVEVGPEGNARIIVPIRSLLWEGEGDNHNYDKVKKAIVELMKSPIFVERPKLKNGVPILDKDGKQEYEFFGFQILNVCNLNSVRGAALIEVNRITWMALLDFTRGFRKIFLEDALKLSLVSSQRLYRLICNQKYPITFTIEQLRSMWGMDELVPVKKPDPLTGELKETGEMMYDLYKDTNSFIRGTVEKAKEELDRKASWSFTYNKNYAKTGSNRGRAGRKSITSITFFPVRRIKNARMPELVRMTSNAAKLLGREAYDILVYKLEFTPKGLQNNVELFYYVKKTDMDILSFLRHITPGAVRSPNPQGYTIKAIRQHLTEAHGLEFDASGHAVNGEDLK